MSYDMSIGNETFNYTYNVSKMWYSCYKKKGIRKHYGLTGKQAIPVLQGLYTHMILNNEKLKEYNPVNGWGDFDGALKFVSDLMKASVNNLDEVWVGD